ncbi:tyrosine-type recombinase/integrase [Micromonospora coriariae]|uniref:tyrosine-type recombinase/integrase n=1 Tax=Micromonospora coriariae TaxID=285665 RepID=UPI0022B26242|nr:tyrosine-type recombinase/integrase [Micromonospora coriariae]
MEITLPWEDPTADERRTVALVLTTTRNAAIRRSTFDERAWRPAVTAAGMVPTRATGMHALRHFYASALLDAGESIKALASYLGHTDPGFTLRVYTHLMPSSEERTRQATDNFFPEVDGSEGDALGTP